MGDVLVILDTNALYSDPTCSRPATLELLALVRRGLLRLAVPEVVLRELQRQRADTIANQIEALNAAPRKVQRALRELDITAVAAGVTLPTAPTVDSSELVTAYASHLRCKLVENRVEILPIPAVDHEKLIDRDLAKRRPFDSNGRGYRDALIWETLSECCKNAADDTVVIFVTDDANFGADGGLDPELAQESVGWGPAVMRASSIEELRSRPEVAPAAEVLRIELSEVSREEMSDVVRNAVEPAVEQIQKFEPSEDDLEMLGVPDEIDGIEITSAESDGGFSWRSYDEFGDTTVLVQASIDVMLHLHGYVEKEHSAVLASQDIDVEAWEYGMASVTLERPARATFDLRVETPGPSVESVKFLGLELG